ncbi:MAG TPA: hypothetical protein VKV39_19410 [Candidatus Sulfotelmatobacter sp.]|nr:hypothetical protein [Candidatus Sulfotelmatobacter sp.]
MKNAARVLAMAMTILPLMAAAQGNHRISANIPFEFVAGDKVAPAGTYTMNITGWDLSQALLQNRAAKFAIYSMVSPAEPPKTASSSALVFHRYGSQYFLVGVRMSNSMTSYTVPAGHAEKELKARNVPETDEILLALAQ